MSEVCVEPVRAGSVMSLGLWLPGLWHRHTDQRQARCVFTGRKRKREASSTAYTWTPLGASGGSILPHCGQAESWEHLLSFLSMAHFFHHLLSMGYVCGCKETTGSLGPLCTLEETRNEIETGNSLISVSARETWTQEGQPLLFLPSLHTRCPNSALLPSCKEDRPKAKPSLPQDQCPMGAEKQSGVLAHLKPCAGKRKDPDVLMVQRLHSPRESFSKEENRQDCPLPPNSYIPQGDLGAHELFQT